MHICVYICNMYNMYVCVYIYIYIYVVLIKAGNITTHYYYCYPCQLTYPFQGHREDIFSARGSATGPTHRALIIISIILIIIILIMISISIIDYDPLASLIRKASLSGPSPSKSGKMRYIYRTCTQTWLN